MESCCHCRCTSCPRGCNALLAKCIAPSSCTRSRRRVLAAPSCTALPMAEYERQTSCHPTKDDTITIATHPHQSHQSNGTQDGTTAGRGKLGNTAGRHAGLRSRPKIRLPPLSSATLRLWLIETTAATPSLTCRLPSKGANLYKPSALQEKYKRTYVIHNIASSTLCKGAPPVRFTVVTIRGRTVKGLGYAWHRLSGSRVRRQTHVQRTGPTWCVTLWSSWLSVPFIPDLFF